MKTMARFFYIWSISLVALPVFATTIGDMVPFKNGRPVDSTEFRADSKRCAREATTQYPSTTVNDLYSSEPRRQDATRKFAHVLGTDMSSENEVLTDLGRQLREQIQTAQEARSRISEKEKANLTGNPLGWLHGQLTIEEDWTIYNRAMSEANETSKLISTLTKATQAVNSTQAGLDPRIPYPSSMKRGHDGAVEYPGTARSNIADQRGKYHYRCMLALGYDQLHVQDPRVGGPSEFTEFPDGSVIVECRVSTDCESGKSCRSRSGGGTECR